MLAICACLMHADRRDGMFTRGPAWCEAATVRRAWQRSRWCGEGWGGDEESEVGGKYGSRNGREYCADDLAVDVLASLFLSLLLLIYLRCHPLSACTELRLKSGFRSADLGLPLLSEYPTPRDAAVYCSALHAFLDGYDWFSFQQLWVLCNRR